VADDVFDIVVVGGGGAGLMAAFAAARLGRSVLVLEKSARIGGTTALSVGTICATSTRLQKQAGIEDSPTEHLDDMARFPGVVAERDNLELRRTLVENVPETIAILSDIGVAFMGPLPEPPHRKSRLHAIIPHARGYIRHIERACRRLGVTILTTSRAERLLTERGRVSGVEITVASSTATGPRPVRARRGVILASGDFSSAPLAFKRRFMSGPLLEIDGINPASTGDGQRMGEEIGAVVVNGDLAWGPEIRFLAPARSSFISKLPTSRWFARLLLFAMQTLPQALVRPFLLGFVTTYLAPSPRLFELGAVLVNAKGERFCDELDRPQDHIGRQPGQSAFIVFDAATAERFEGWPNFISTAPGVGHAYLRDYARSRPDVYATAPSLHALAEKLSVPAEPLVKTVRSHNEQLAADAGAKKRGPIAKAPFHALGPAKSWIVFSDGGLKIDLDFRVSHRDGHAIPGLYAAGSAGQGGVLLEGHGHHLAWAFTSGRLAGRNAALAPCRFEESRADRPRT
jgi:succinate dehydrogenase/fumarate reductase flavoprotein subunit